MKLQSKFFIIGLTSALLVAGVVVSNQWSTRIMENTKQNLLHASVITQRHMVSDMMHDAVRSDIMAALMANMTSDAEALHEAKTDLNEHTAKLQKNLSANSKERLPEEIHHALQEASNTASQYQLAAADVLNDLAEGQDPAAARALFNQKFVELETLMEEASDSIIAWSDKNSAHAEAVVKKANQISWGLSLLSILIALAVPIYAWRGVFVPNNEISNILQDIANGKVDIEVHGTGRHDEIGSLARSALKLQESITDSARLRADQERIKLETESQRKREMHQLAAMFEDRVQGVVSAVAAAATQLAQTADSTISSTGRSQQMAHDVAHSAEQTAANVKSVASAAEELSSAVQEISSQLMRSNQLVTDSVHKTQDADNRAKGLATAAEKVKEVVGLISEIASQTNLLALNATIESARAGEAGRGFAVVASEVKNLATQTGNSIVDINKVIQEMMMAAGDITTSLTDIRQSVMQISEASSGISSAVEEQAATTNEIMRSMQTAAQGTSVVNKSVSEISAASEQANGSSQEVAAAARELSIQAEVLDRQVHEFLREIRNA